MKKTLLASAVLMTLGSGVAVGAEVDGMFQDVYVFDNSAENWVVLDTGSKQGVGHTGINVNAKEIEINSKENGVSAYGDVTLTAVGNVTVNSVKNGLFLADDSNNPNQKITVNAGGDLVIKGTGWGIHGERGKLEINAANVVVNSNHGITANGSSSLKVKSDGDINIAVDKFHGIIALGTGSSIELDAADDIVITQADDVSASATAIRSGEGNIKVVAGGSTIIDGNIRAGGSGDVNVAFNGEDSLFKGAVLTEGSGETTIQMTGGAKWVAEGSSVVSNLKLEDSTIDMTGATGDIDVVNLEGTSATLLMSVDNDAGFNAQGGSNTLSITAVAQENADEVTQEEASALVERITGVTDKSATVKEGMYNGAMTVAADGVVATETNSIMSNTLDLASAAPLAMNRLLMNDVRKRMGDLRAAEGTHGVWARYDGGKLSGERGLENDFTTVQVGIDTVPVADAPRFGVAFAYTTSEADMMRGSADMDAFSLAFYGTKMYDNGMFVDVIGRMATADTDIVVDGDKKGSMDNVALSLSGELGWRFDVTDKFYFEPQAELTYTYVNADKLALGGSSYEFDSVDSLMGRVGFAAGFKCPNNFGDVYVRASAVHEFLGDSAVTGGNGTIHEVDGEDTWVEFGIGGQFNINKNTYVYADVERTDGAKLEEDWRANVGVRFAF